MKAIAFYLPQFHEIPENSEWWGEGFTEWTSVKNAKPLYLGHKQPVIPRKGDYYCLLNKSVMEQQTKSAIKAGIYGFCFYHYWFRGKKVLEKPVENYLEWTDLPQKYCLSWANESWVRTWSNVPGNDWCPIEDRKRARKGKEVLLAQSYGNKTDWLLHFQYLLPFFKDQRYIKIDGKPLFLIHRPLSIPCLNAMIAFWKKAALKEGLKGLYVVATNAVDIQAEAIDGVVLYEPDYTLHFDKYLIDRYKIKEKPVWGTGLLRLQYEKICRRIIHRHIKSSKPLFLGIFTAYDDTPRRGDQKGMVIESTPKQFGQYLRKLVKKGNRKQFGEYLFITAWNEWAEGAYLEPDKIHGYSYLQSVRNALKSEK